MAPVWIKLEAVKAIENTQQLYQEHLEQLQVNYPTSQRLNALYHRNQVLQTDILRFYSVVETRVYVGIHINGPNPLENDERFDLETEQKNALYAALSQFRAEPEFKSLNESLENPQAVEVKELSKKNLELEQEMNDLKQKLSQEENNGRQYNQELNDVLADHDRLQARIEHLNSLVQERNGTIRHIQQDTARLNTVQRQLENTQLNLRNKDNTIANLQGENASMFNQLQTARREKNEAVQGMRHAVQNHDSIRKAFIMTDGRKGELEDQVRVLQQDKLGLAEQITQLTEQLRQAQISNNNVAAARQGTGYSSITRSPGNLVSRQQAIENLLMNNTPPGQSAPSTSAPIRNPSTASQPRRPRQQANVRLTHVQERVYGEVVQLNDTQLEMVEPTVEEARKPQPSPNHHWVHGHWRLNPGTKIRESRGGMF